MSRFVRGSRCLSGQELIQAARFVPFLLGLMVAGPALLLAQEGRPVLPRITLAAEGRQAASRLEAADRLCGRIPDPEALVLLVGTLVPGGGGPVGTAATFAAERHSQEKWLEALEEYQRLIYEAGDALVPLPGRPGNVTVPSLQLRKLCHQRIAAFPPAILRWYRQRVDVQAQKWLQQARQTHDVPLLRRLVDEVFCCRVGDQALELLGDLAFEKGHFAEALAWWQRLTPPASTATAPNRQSLLFPDPTVDLARVRAKQILAHLFQGENDQVQAELKAFQTRHPDARGSLAGRSGVLLDILGDVRQQWEKNPFWEDQEPWATFAGNAARNRVVSACPSPRLWVDGPSWRVPLDSSKNGDRSSAWRRPVYYPLIVGDRVLLANGQTIKGYHLLTGAEVFRHDGPDPGLGGPGKNEPDSDAGYTLTAHRGRLFARLGRQRLEPGRNAARQDETANYLICLDIRPDSGKDEGGLRWKIKAAEGVLFEGAPLAHADRVYLALSRVVGKHTKTAIACYDADTGTVRWQHELCDTPEFEVLATPRARQHLLTLAGGLVVYCSHSGVIVAVDAGSGQAAWALRYPVRPAQALEGELSPRDLCPCVYSSGRIFAAPQDSDRLLCLEAATGRLLWQREGIEVVHLLGVASGQVLFTTPRGLQAVPAATGDDTRGWAQPAEGKLTSLGRGLLLGGWVFWPTQYPHLPLRALSQEDGSQDRPESGTGPAYFDPTLLRHIRPGNLALAQGSLVVADGEELVAYVAPQRLLQERRGQAGPLLEASAGALYQLAQAEAAAGQFLAARQHFALAAAKTGADPLLQRKVLEQCHTFLLETASGAVPAADARLLLDEAAQEKFPPERRVEALMRLAVAYLRAEQPAGALASWQKILADETLRSIAVSWEKGTWQRAGPAASTAIAVLLQQQEPGFRQTYQKQAEELFATARAKPGETSLHKLVQEFPHTPAAAKARQELVARKKTRNSNKATGRSPPPLRPLSLPVERIWQASCGRGLPVTQPSSASGKVNLFLGVAGTQGRCVDAATGAVLWEAPLTVAPTWAGCHADFLFVAGPEGIQALDLGDGQPLWRLATADTLLGPLSQFRLTAGYLLCLADERLLLALELDSGAIRWHSWAPAGPIRPLEGGRFHPHFYAGEHQLLLQTSGGRRQVLDPGTGRLLHQTAAGKTPWPHSPLPLDEHRLCLAEEGRLFLWNLAANKEEWSYRPPWPTSLTGEPLQVVGDRQGLLVLVPRNHGCDLVRLDPARGISLWGDGVHVGRQHLSVHQVARQQDDVILVTANQLQGRSLADGKLRWTAYLPDAQAPWCLQSARFAVLAYPREEEQLQGWWTPLSYFPFVWPNMRPSRPRGEETWMIQLHDPQDGQLRQRLNFAAAWPGSSRLVHLGPGQLVVAVGGRAWGLGGWE